jgi:S-adenosylmethionine hydrolase
MIIGEVTYIDNFGNIISNINKDFFENISKGYESFTIKFRNLAFQESFPVIRKSFRTGKGKQNFMGSLQQSSMTVSFWSLPSTKEARKTGLKACLD